MAALIAAAAGGFVAYKVASKQFHAAAVSAARYKWIEEFRLGVAETLSSLTIVNGWHRSPAKNPEELKSRDDYLDKVNLRHYQTDLLMDNFAPAHGDFIRAVVEAVTAAQAGKLEYRHSRRVSCMARDIIAMEHAVALGNKPVRRVFPDTKLDPEVLQ